MPLDFAAYVEAQTGQLKKLAAFAQEHGYWLWFSSTKADPLPGMISATIAGALVRMLKEHADHYGRRTPMAVTVTMSAAIIESSRAAGKILLDDPPLPKDRIAVRFELPNRVKFRPMVGALSLVAEQHGRLVEPDRALFTHHKMSDRHEYYGRGKGALSAALAIFNMPENRALLKG